MTKEYSGYLAHHGVKGMRWGVRKDRDTGGRSGRKKKPESANWKPKDVSDLSDEELNRRLSRLNKEKQYKDLTAGKGDKAKKWLAKTAQTILVATAVGALGAAMRGHYTTLVKKVGATTLEMIKSHKELNALSRGKTLSDIGLKG